MKKGNYKGKGEHLVNELELIIEQQAEELHLIKSGQKPLITDGVSKSFYCGCDGLDEKDLLCNIIQCEGCAKAESEQ